MTHCDLLSSHSNATLSENRASFFVLLNHNIICLFSGPYVVTITVLECWTLSVRYATLGLYRYAAILLQQSLLFTFDWCNITNVTMYIFKKHNQHNIPLAISMWLIADPSPGGLRKHPFATIIKLNHPFLFPRLIEEIKAYAGYGGPSFGCLYASDFRALGRSSGIVQELLTYFATGNTMPRIRAIY